MLQTISDREEYRKMLTPQIKAINDNVRSRNELKHVTCNVCKKMVKRQKSNQIMCNECESKPENSIENHLEKVHVSRMKNKRKISVNQIKQRENAMLQAHDMEVDYFENWEPCDKRLRKESIFQAVRGAVA